MRILLLLTVTVAFFIGCATIPLTSAEKKVKVLRKSDAPMKCEEVGSVHAPGLASLTEEGRIKDLRRATHKAGGNLVTINRRDENNTIYGTAFKCP